MTISNQTMADLKVGDQITIAGETAIITHYRLSTVGTAKGNVLMTVLFQDNTRQTLIFKNAAQALLVDVAAVPA